MKRCKDGTRWGDKKNYTPSQRTAIWREVNGIDDKPLRIAKMPLDPLVEAGHPGRGIEAREEIARLRRLWYGNLSPVQAMRMEMRLIRGMAVSQIAAVDGISRQAADIGLRLAAKMEGVGV